MSPSEFVKVIPLAFQARFQDPPQTESDSDSTKSDFASEISELIQSGDLSPVYSGGLWRTLRGAADFVEEVPLQAVFDTASLDRVLLSRIDTIQLKTTIANESAPQGTYDFITRFDISLYRPWGHLAPRPGPRVHWPDGNQLRWESHSQLWNTGNEHTGRIFTREHELIKQLEFGDLIAIDLCGQRNPASMGCTVRAEMVVKFIAEEEVIKQPPSNQPRRYSPKGPCTIDSYNSSVESDIWFTTSALDENVLSNLDTIQLFTESRDQGWVGDGSTASYSWFDVVILSSPGNKEPRSLDGVELSWRSHSNLVASRDFGVMKGLIFDRNHDLIKLLEPGNAIGIRVSARFSGWKNQANDGCLELRFADNKFDHKEVEAEPTFVEAVQKKDILAEYLTEGAKRYCAVVESEPRIAEIRERLEVLARLDREEEPLPAAEYEMKESKGEPTFTEGISEKGLPTELEWDDIKDHEAQAFAFEIDPIVVQLLYRTDKSDELDVQKKPDIQEEPEELMLLSLDGGGVRGLISLYVLKAIMKGIQSKYPELDLEETPRPCQVFDLIVGTSTGGLIALMLGRLGMSVDECILKYEILAEKVFGERNADRYEKQFGTLNWYRDLVAQTKRYFVTGAMYEASELKDAIQEVVREAGVNDDAKLQDSTECRAMVLASQANNLTTHLPTGFRSYHSEAATPEDARASDCTIWEAARATTAAPAYFDPIDVGGVVYMDGGLQANNPVNQTVLESQLMFGPQNRRPIGCLISLGTGMPPAQGIPPRERGLWAAVKGTLSLGRAILAELAGAHMIHLLFEQWNKIAGYPYYRLNPPLGADLSLEEEKWESKYVGLDDTSKIPDFRRDAENYMKTTDAQRWMEECAEILGKRLKKQRGIS